jgi:hypothetical protein
LGDALGDAAGDALRHEIAGPKAGQATC